MQQVWQELKMANINQDDLPYGLDAKMLARLQALQGEKPSADPVKLNIPSTDEDNASEVAAPQAVLKSEPLPAPTESEEDNTDPSEASTPMPSASSILAKYKNLQENPTPNPKSVSETLENLLGSTKQSVAQAKKDRDAIQLGALFSKLGNTIGNAVTPLSAKLDNSMSDALMEQSKQPMNDLLAESTINKDALQNQVLKGKTRTEMDKTDPNSAISQAAKDFYKKTTGKDADETMSASDLESLDPMLARLFNAQESGKNRQLASKNSADNKQDSLDQKSDDKQNLAVKDVQTMIETTRGSTDIRNAKEATRLVDNANSLLSEYPDLNKMPTAQVTLFAQELAKIAKGGVSGEAEVRDIMPHSVASGLMKGLSQLEGSPTGAQLGAFIKEYQPYLDAIKKNSIKLVNDRTHRILNAQSKRLGDDNSKMLNDLYFPPPMASAEVVPPMPQGGAPMPAPAASSDSVNMIDPKGNVRSVPKSMVQSALAAGGKMAE